MSQSSIRDTQQPLVDALRPFVPVVATYLPQTRDARKVFGDGGRDMFLSEFRRAQDLVSRFDAGQVLAFSDLAQALQPFASIADEYLEEFGDQKGVTGIDEVRLYLGDFRRARTQLAQVRALLSTTKQPGRLRPLGAERA